MAREGTYRCVCVYLHVREREERKACKRERQRGRRRRGLERLYEAQGGSDQRGRQGTMTITGTMYWSILSEVISSTCTYPLSVSCTCQSIPSPHPAAATTTPLHGTVAKPSGRKCAHIVSAWRQLVDKVDISCVASLDTCGCARCGGCGGGCRAPCCLTFFLMRGNKEVRFSTPPPITIFSGDARRMRLTHAPAR